MSAEPVPHVVEQPVLRILPRPAARAFKPAERLAQHGLRILQARQKRRWERLIDRQIQNTEIQTVSTQIEGQALAILRNPGDEAAVRQAAELIVKLARELAKREGQDAARDEEEAGELRLVDRELAALAKPSQLGARPRAGRP